MTRRNIPTPTRGRGFDLRADAGRGTIGRPCDQNARSFIRHLGPPADPARRGGRSSPSRPWGAGRPGAGRLAGAAAGVPRHGLHAPNGADHRRAGRRRRSGGAQQRQPGRHHHAGGRRDVHGPVCAPQQAGGRLDLRAEQRARQRPALSGGPRRSLVRPADAEARGWSRLPRRDRDGARGASLPLHRDRGGSHPRHGRQPQQPDRTGLGRDGCDGGPARHHLRPVLHPRRPVRGGGPRHLHEHGVHGRDRLVPVGLQAHGPGYRGDHERERPGALQDRQQLPGSGRDQRHVRRARSDDSQPRARRHRDPRQLLLQAAVVADRGPHVRRHPLERQEPARIEERAPGADRRQRLRE